MDLDEDNEQKRKDFNNIYFLNTTLSGAAKFNLRSAKIYAPLLPECRSTCLRTAAVSTVIKLLQAGLKS